MGGDHTGHPEVGPGNGGCHLHAHQTRALMTACLRALGSLVDTASVLDGAQVVDLAGDLRVEAGEALGGGAGGDQQLVVGQPCAVREGDVSGSGVELDGRRAEMAGDAALAVVADIAEVQRRLGDLARPGSAWSRPENMPYNPRWRPS